VVEVRREIGAARVVRCPRADAVLETPSPGWRSRG